MKHAVAYLRVSTELQAGPGTYGLDAQREAIEAFAAGKYVIDVWFSDEGISGADMSRPGLADAMDAAKEKTVDAILVAKLDRAARDLFGQLYVEDTLSKSDARLISVAEPYGNDDPQSRLMRQMLGAFAEFEKSLIAARLTGGRRAKARQGGYAGGAAPLGYVAEDGALRVDVKARDAVQFIFLLHESNPGMTLREVAQRVNEEGHRTARGCRFLAQTIKRVLDRAATYRGKYAYAGVTAEGQHEAIL